MQKSEFLKRYNISAESFASTGISWEMLEEIRAHYLQIRDELEPTARQIVNILHKTAKIHSVRYRIKDPEHLMAKIIRKRIGEPQLIINRGNYQREITDLIGIRVLHLFKEDWGDIHSFILRSWNLLKAPVAYVRRGDAAGYINSFLANGCRIEEHPYGYRSVHYLLKSLVSGKEQISEVQVRTLFEEAWSSIDHHVRYPYEPRNVLLNELLVILNRLAGSADELGSYIIFLQEKLKAMDPSFLEGEHGEGRAGAVFQLLDEFEWPAELGAGLRERLTPESREGAVKPRLFPGRETNSAGGEKDPDSSPAPEPDEGEGKPVNSGQS